MSIIKFDPLKNLGTSSSSSGFNTTDLVIKAAGAVFRNQRAKKAQRKMEEEREQYERKLQDAIQSPPPLHGSARWASPAELAKAGLLRAPSAFDTPSSLLLGVLRDTDGGGNFGQLHWDDEGHIVTVAPTRSGKSTTLIVPNLLRYRGSCVVLDPKGELYRDTAAWRSTLGPVYKIAPFEADTDSFNALDTVRTISDARAVADILIPPDPKAQEFFRTDAMAYLSAVILSVALSAPPHRRNLKEIRDITAGPLDGFLEYARDLAASGISELANPAHVLLEKRRDSLPTLRDTFNSNLAIWDDRNLGAQPGATVDFRTLKDQTATVYVRIPFGKMKAYSPYLKLLLGTALDAMLLNENTPKIPVLFVLDEFLSLGPFPEFVNAIRTHAGAGVRLWFFLQNLATLEAEYGQSWKAFLDAAVKVFFGTKDAYTGRLISETILGNATTAHLNASLSQSDSAPSGGYMGHGGGNVGQSVNTSISYGQRPLMTPTEAVAFLGEEFADKSRNAIVSIGGVPYPIKAKLEPWFKGAICQSRVKLPLVRP